MRWSWVMAVAGTLGCAPEAPPHPTWTDVRPILAGQCTHCHGSTAAEAGGGIRFDFYEMTPEVCGQAAQVMTPDKPLGRYYAGKIWEAITTTPSRPGTRPLMPPPPAPYLDAWEWQTIGRWVADGAPRGELRPGNRPARFRIYRDSGPADRTLDVTVVIEDPDGDPVVGVLTFGDVTLNMDRAGAFSATLDTSKWEAGERAISAVLCDGWSNVSYAVGTLTVAHAP
jgi:hypothetical protein